MGNKFGLCCFGGAEESLYEQEPDEPLVFVWLSFGGHSASKSEPCISSKEMAFAPPLQLKVNTILFG